MRNCMLANGTRIICDILNPPSLQSHASESSLRTQHVFDVSSLALTDRHRLLNIDLTLCLGR